MLASSLLTYNTEGTMVRIVVLLLFVLALAASPVLAFDQLVLPELFSLKQVYGNAEATAQQIF